MHQPLNRIEFSIMRLKSASKPFTVEENPIMRFCFNVRRSRARLITVCYVEMSSATASTGLAKGSESLFSSLDKRSTSWRRKTSCVWVMSNTGIPDFPLLKSSSLFLFPRLDLCCLGGDSKPLLPIAATLDLSLDLRFLAGEKI